MRGIPAGIDLRSPSRHPDVLGADDLVIKVEEFREATGYEQAGLGEARRGPRPRRHQDRLQGRLRLRRARRHAGLDRRRRAPRCWRYVGIPTLSAIRRRSTRSTRSSATATCRSCSWAAVKDGIDAAKAIALGAHGVAMGTAARSSPAAASPACSATSASASWASPPRTRSTRSATTSTGEAREHPPLPRGGALAARRRTHALGHSDVRQLSRDDLVALTPEAAAITGLPYDPSYKARQNELSSKVA